MHERRDPSPELLALAAAQAGVLSLEQSEQLGLTRHSRQRLVASGRWHRLGGPTYYTCGADPSWDSFA